MADHPAFSTAARISRNVRRESGMRIKAGARRSFRIYGFTPEGCRNSRGKSMARIDGHGVSIDTRTEAFKVNTEDFKRG